jgi:hypothetical protein|tara:strand:- start:151 stop:585 length:435 start_codon:yes stop_codon:yes gene_type:complete
MKKKDKLRKKLFRDFVLRDNTEFNYLQQLKNMKRRVNKEYPVSMGELEFMLWATDFEFWTLRFASKQLGMYKNKMAERVVYPLANRGYIYKFYDRLTTGGKYEDFLFREETKFNYEVRYALTQKGRNVVERFYRELESYSNITS